MLLCRSESNGVRNTPMLPTVRRLHTSSTGIRFGHRCNLQARFREGLSMRKKTCARKSSYQFATESMSVCRSTMQHSTHEKIAWIGLHAMQLLIYLKFRISFTWWERLLRTSLGLQHARFSSRYRSVLLLLTCSNQPLSKRSARRNVSHMTWRNA